MTDSEALILSFLTVTVLYLMGYKLRKVNFRSPILSWANPIEAPRTVYLFVFHLFKS